MTPEEFQHIVQSLLDKIARLEKEIIELRTQLAERDKTIEELKSRLNKNSSNSSKPPSSDKPWVKRPGKAATGKKKGAQAGHVGRSRKQVPSQEVDAIVKVEVASACQHCSDGVVVQRKIRRRHQVWEIPAIKPHVTEYQLEGGRCNCCKKRSTAQLPVGVPNGMLGARAQATASYLTGNCRLSRRQTEEIFHTAFGLKISLGTVSNTETNVSEILEKPYEEAKLSVLRAPVINADETGHQESNIRCWIWVFATPLAAFFKVGAKRSREAFTSEVGEDFSGIVTSDRYNAYSHLPDQRRQLCWAHFRRELKSISEKKGHVGKIGKKLLMHCDEMFASWKKYRSGEKSREEMADEIELIRRKMENVFGKHFLKNEQLRSLAHTFILQPDAVWRFTDTDGIEPTNNLAERDLRPAVIWRKTSLFTQSERGNRYAERMLTFAATCKKQKKNVFNMLAQTIDATMHQLPYQPLFLG